MQCQCEMKSVGGANQQMKPDQEWSQVPKQIEKKKRSGDNERVGRKEIRGQGDQAIALIHYHVTSSRGNSEVLDPPAKGPRPQSVRELVTKNINPHGLWQHPVHHTPTGGSRQQTHPDCLC